MNIYIGSVFLLVIVVYQGKNQFSMLSDMPKQPETCQISWTWLLFTWNNMPAISLVQWGQSARPAKARDRQEPKPVPRMETKAPSLFFSYPRPHSVKQAQLITWHWISSGQHRLLRLSPFQSERLSYEPPQVILSWNTIMHRPVSQVLIVVNDYKPLGYNVICCTLHKIHKINFIKIYCNVQKMNTHHQLYIYEAWVYPPGLKNKANWCLKIK